MNADISKNGRYFLDKNECPYFWLGDTQWNLFRCHTLKEAKIIIEDRKDKGFTFIQVMLLGFKMGVEAEPVFGEAFPENDPTAPNLKYFEHVDSVIKLAQENGIVLVIGLDHPVIKLTDRNTARAYGRWIGERYKEYGNIIWVATYLIPEGEALQVIRELTAGLHEGDGGSHLITSHPDPACPVATSGISHNEDWLDFNCIQTFSSIHLIYEATLRDYNRTSPKPVVMAEGAYENGPEYGFDITPQQIRKQAYLTYFAGGHYSYGHNDSWRVHPTWKSSLNSTGARQMMILKDIFTSKKWWELVPDQKVFEDESCIGDTSYKALRALSGDLLMIYSSCQATFTVHLNIITAAQKVKTYWIDPRNGYTVEAGTFTAADVCTFSCPIEWEDSLLIIEPDLS